MKKINSIFLPRLIDYHMYYFKVDIPSIVLPMKEYHLEKLGMVLFPSNKNTSSRNITFDNTLMTLIIYSDSLLTKAMILNRVKKLITFHIFYSADFHSCRWLINLWTGGIEKEVLQTTDLSEVIKSHLEIDFLAPSSFYKDFTRISPSFRSNEVRNFLDLFETYYNLPDESKLKQQIDLFTITWVIYPVVSNIYDNANLPIALTYTLIDSLMSEVSVIENEVKKCEKCGHEKIGRKSDRKRIKESVSNLTFSGDDERLFGSIILNLYKIRNDFFHEGKSVSNLENIDKSMSTKDGKKGKSTTIEAEATYGESRYIGLLNTKLIIRNILLDSLVTSK